MLTAGVDLASRPAATAVCAVAWGGGRAAITRLDLGADDDSIVEGCAGADRIGVDVPLGWPLAFARAVAGHARHGSWPAGYHHSTAVDYRYRRTDLWLWRTLRMPPPLSVSTDRIALPAMRAAALVPRLWGAAGSGAGAGREPLDGSGLVVEAYPAAALRLWGLPSRMYKGAKNAGTRWALIERLLGVAGGWLDAGAGHVELCRRSDDALDALIAALIARAAAMGQVEPVPAGDRHAARREGWIAVPLAGSLARLARPAGAGG